MTEINRKITKILLVTEIVVLIFCALFGVLEFSHKINNKASLFADSIRNDFLLNDQKSVLQKIQIATISHDFKGIEVVGAGALGPRATVPRFSITSQITIRSIPEQSDSVELGRVIFTYSVFPGLLNGLILWGIVSAIVICLVPLMKSYLQEILSRELEIKRIKEINKMASAVAHDIRSPLSALNSIISNSAFIQSETRKILSEVSERINAIANELLQNSKLIATPDAAKNPVPNSLKNVIKRVIAEKTNEYSENTKIKLSLRDENLGEGICVQIPEMNLMRILSNVINNSVEAMVDDGNIIIQVHSRGNEGIIKVIDSGTGIPEEVLGKLMRSTVTTKVSGSGIGLSSAYEMVKKYGGNLSILSKVGVGTEVTISFPLDS